MDTSGAQESLEEQQISEPVDEASRLEERRRRREAIRAKYRGQATPLRLQALQAGAEREFSSTPSIDASVTNKTESGEFLSSGFH